MKTIKKIVVFGATGGTGKEVVKQALALGYEVTAIVRNPSLVDSPHPLLSLIKGDVLNLSSFEDQISGKDAVISCLGTGKNLQPTEIYSKGLRNIITAMQKAKVNRLLCITAGALYTNKKMGFFIRLLTKVILQKILKNIYSDMRIMEKEVESSNLDWTIVRPPMLKDKPLSAKYRTAVNSHISRPFSIARADLAHFILRNMFNPKTFKTKAEIAY